MKDYAFYTYLLTVNVNMLVTGFALTITIRKVYTNCWNCQFKRKSFMTTPFNINQILFLNMHCFQSFKNNFSL